MSSQHKHTPEKREGESDRQIHHAAHKTKKTTSKRKKETPHVNALPKTPDVVNPRLPPPLIEPQKFRRNPLQPAMEHPSYDVCVVFPFPCARSSGESPKEKKFLSPSCVLRRPQNQAAFLCFRKKIPICVSSLMRIMSSSIKKKTLG